MGGGCLKKYSTSHSTLDSNKIQCSGRLPLKARHGQLGALSGQKHLHLRGGALLCLPQSGCFRLPLVGPAPSLHVLVQGQSGSGTGCPSESLGSDYLSLPTCTSPSQGDQEGEGGEDQSIADMPILADRPMVGSVGGHVSGASHGTTPLQDHNDPLQDKWDHSLPGSSGGTSSSLFRQAFALSTASFDLDQNDIDFLSNHLSSGTALGYGYVFNLFKSFCETLQVSPLTCPPAVIVKYICKLTVSGAQYSTVNYHRSAISKFHVGVAGVPIGEHPLVCQAVRAVFRLRPPLPKYQSAFDIVPVLAYFANQPTCNLSLKPLVYKTLFLTIYSSLSRVSSISRLGPTIIMQQESVVLHFTSLEKQGRVGQTRGFLQIPQFSEDPELCPVRTLLMYRDRVS